MMKALKTGLIGLAFGVAAALVVPSTEASAQSSCVGCPGGGSQPCCSSCNPFYAQCVANAGGNTSKINQCASTRASCESSCRRTC
ncbi:hypothetical protein [Cystobacter ferrugineus]|uniref:hypothetical protein n=1 Tax=Cystobacter ferrugineus TaxID=83449 RepID=UPI0011610D22|nr:hypothetical protein [Cystobacter ferrugineus]